MTKILIKNLILNFGYAEDAKLSMIILSTDTDGYETLEGALKSLAKQIYDFVQEEISLRMRYRECCKEAQDKGNFCPKCGSDLGYLSNRAEYFYEFLLTIPDMTNDTSGYLFYEHEWSNPFSLFELKINKKNTAEIVEMAEQELLWAARDLFSSESDKKFINDNTFYIESRSKERNKEWNGLLHDVGEEPEIEP